MKKSVLILVACLALLSCKKDEDKKPVAVEKVKMYIYASNGIYLTSDPHSLEISGTNIETVTNVTNSHIIEANYPKGKSQTIRIKALKPEHYVYLQVSKDINQRPEDYIINTFKQGYIEVSFVAN